LLALTTIVLASLLSNGPAQEVATFRVQPPPRRESSVHVRIPYTFGTHDLVGRDVSGQVSAIRQTLQVLGGRISFPIDALDAGNRTLECHTREALGLDYGKSKFPGEHVCQDNRLPPSGNDAVAFPNITFDCVGSRQLERDPRAPNDGSARLELTGRWTIHGVTRDDKLVLTVTPLAAQGAAPAAIRVKGRITIHLASYGIRVKPALVIHAGDDATVDLDLLLAEAK